MAGSHLIRAPSIIDNQYWAWTLSRSAQTQTQAQAYAQTTGSGSSRKRDLGDPRCLRLCQAPRRRISSYVRVPIRANQGLRGLNIIHVPPFHNSVSISQRYRQTPTRSFSSTPLNKMATEFSKVTLSAGNGTDFPQTGDNVLMEYTGYLYDESAKDKRGTVFDSSVGRGDFATAIGVGRVIQGWDQGVPQMSLGERAVLTIPGPMAYGSRGFPGLIPANATLIFEVQLKGINDKKA